MQQEIIVTSVRNPVWADPDHVNIECTITVEAYGSELLPFLAVPNDPEPHGVKIYQDCLAGVYGEIGEYVHRPATSDNNRADAEKKLLATDWVNQPDYTDPNNPPYLSNKDEFIAYRSSLRLIMVDAPEGDLDWPVEPTPVWIK